MSAISRFAQDVDEGLSALPKQLSSKYFYDATGDELFVQIMAMPEYYLTRCEHEIFATKSPQLAQALGLNGKAFVELVELGAGDGTKTQELLGHLLKAEQAFAYVPIDISQHALDGLKSRLTQELPGLQVKPRQGEYFEALASLKTPHQKAVLFLGSNLGNLLDDRAAAFLHELARVLNTGDKVLLGLDLIKDSSIVLPAYNDAAGITSRFNLNLLTRMNKELGADFDLNNWCHFPAYSAQSGVATSSIQSTEDQVIHVDSLKKEFKFVKGECIHTEVSRKYSAEVLSQLIEGSGLVLSETITDSKGWFADFVLTRS